MSLSSSQVTGGLALIGSGELSEAMAETHRTIMAQLRQPVQPVFLDTLAGFESNIAGIDQKAQAYFQRNFGLDLAVARYRTGRESSAEVAAAISAIGQATYILAGPGSPSYGIRVLRESAIWRAIEARWQAGATLVFASAASIIVGADAIPVYEIFKAGHDVAWIPGLDLLSTLGLRVAVVPHWNTTSGDGYDTRFCYMGAARFAALERQLDPAHMILGIDEYTGLYIAPDRRATVLGGGQVTVRVAGQQVTYRRGQEVTLDPGQVAGEVVVLDGGPAPESTPPLAEEQTEGDADILALREEISGALERGATEAAVEGVVALSLIAGMGLEQSLMGRVDLAVQTLQLALPQLMQLAAGLRTIDALHDERDALIHLLISARSALRRAGEWTTADQLRDGLSQLGYVLADTPDGTTWSHVSETEHAPLVSQIPSSHR